MIRNLQGGRFINNKEKYYFPSSAAGSSVATAFCSTKSVIPLLTKILHLRAHGHGHSWEEFLQNKHATRLQILSYSQ